MGFISCQNRTISPFQGTVDLHLTPKKSKKNGLIYAFEVLFSSGWYSGNTQNFCNIFILIIKVPQHGSCVKIWRVKCNRKCLKHMADASDCALALYHLKINKQTTNHTVVKDMRDIFSRPAAFHDNWNRGLPCYFNKGNLWGNQCNLCAGVILEV